MINKDKIVFKTKTYFTCSYTGTVGVKILKLFDDGCVLVENKGGQFVRPLMYVFNTEEDARRGGRDWEHYERKRKREAKKAKKQKNNSPKQGEKSI